MACYKIKDFIDLQVLQVSIYKFLLLRIQIHTC